MVYLVETVLYLTKCAGEKKEENDALKYDTVEPRLGAFVQCKGSDGRGTAGVSSLDGVQSPGRIRKADDLVPAEAGAGDVCNGNVIIKTRGRIHDRGKEGVRQSAGAFCQRNGQSRGGAGQADGNALSDERRRDTADAFVPFGTVPETLKGQGIHMVVGALFYLMGKCFAFAQGIPQAEFYFMKGIEDELRRC